MKHMRVWTMAMALVVLFSLTVMPAAAFELTNGEEYEGVGTIETVEVTENVAAIEGFDYTEAFFKDITKKGQSFYAMEFNPMTTGLIPMVYQPKVGYGSRVSETVEAATAAGYEVVGAINGEFFSMNTENYGMLEGRMVTNGRVMADSEDCNEVCLAIDSNGSFHLVQSQTQYIVRIDGAPVNGGRGVISKINGRFVGTNWWDPMMYFDYATGGATYTNENVKGVEVLCEKVDGTELMIENTLKGKVVSVATDTFGTEMAENQFVLYAQSTSSHHATLAALTAGQEIEIFVDEMNADAESVMKNAMTVSSATYPIVMNGENNVANIVDEGGLVGQRAQRTIIGVKEDGTMVMMCTDGRGKSADYNYGFGLDKLAKMMVALGCKYAAALDGGASSTMWVNGETQFVSPDDDGYIRPVGSSILVCKRNAALTDAAAKDALKAAIDEAKAAETPVTEAKQNAIKNAIEAAQAVYDNANAVTGDYTREVMNLKAALAMDDTLPTEPTTAPTTVPTDAPTSTDAPTTTTVPKPDNSQNSPHTADSHTIVLYLTVAALAMVAILSTAALHKKATR